MATNIFYTSDLHFGHKNIIKYCNRPYSNVAEMNEKLIENWNKRVNVDDHVYVLGDVTMERDPSIYLSKLNGYKHLIIGNHDKQPKLQHGWTTINSMLEMKDSDQPIILCHYKMTVWNGSHYDSPNAPIQLYGHSHGTLSGNNRQLDVGVDCWNYKPVTLSEIKMRLNELPKYGLVL